VEVADEGDAVQIRGGVHGPRVRDVAGR
jgi:hypothetical protein